MVIREFTLANYAQAVGSETYRFLILKALAYGAGIALITAVIAYPLAFAARASAEVGPAHSAPDPLYTGDLVRIFAWRVMLGAEGVLNSLFQWLGLIHEPIWALLFSPSPPSSSSLTTTCRSWSWPCGPPARRWTTA